MAAASTADGSVVIAVDMNVSDAEKELERLKKRALSLEDNIGEQEAQRCNLVQKRLALEKDAEKLKNNRQSLLDSGVPFEDGDFTIPLDDIAGKIEDINAQIAKMDNAIEKDRVSLDYTKSRYAGIAGQAEQLRRDALGLQPVTDGRGLQGLVDGIEVADQKIVALNQELANLKARQKELDKAGIGLGFQVYDENVARIAEINQELKDYQETLQEISLAEPLQDAAEVAKAADQYIADLNQELAELKARQKELEKSGNGLGFEEYDRNTGRIAVINQELKDYKKSLESAAADGVGNDARQRLSAWAQKSGGLFQKLDGLVGKSGELSGVWQELPDKISGAMEKVKGTVEQIGQETVDTLARGGRAIVSFAAAAGSGLVGALSVIGKYTASAVKGVGKLSGKLAGFVGKCNVFSKAADALKGKLGALASLLRQALDPSLITGGLQSVRTLISGCLQANDALMIALRRLQGALLTAFQPIYEIVVPALTTLINVLTHAAATIAQFFASLFGTTAKRAQANAEALYNQATATTAAGDAAEEAAKQLAAFDEINKLEGNKSAGGGGAASVDMGPLFDYEYDETPFDSWGKAFSDFLDKLLDGISKLREAFKNFADWLNDFAKKLYDMFTFPGVLDKVKRLGKELAEALNDLVNWIDWEMLGRALGAGLNLALNFLTSFLYAFDWMNLGRKLAEFVNGLVDEIDWYEFGRLLWAGFKIGLETFAGFLTGLDMPLLADAANRTVFGFFDEMLNTINRIPWGGIGQQIARFLNEIDWYGMITKSFAAISAAWNALFTMVRGFIDELRWGDIATQIYRAVNDSMGKIRWDDIGKTIGDAFKKVFGFVKNVVAGIRWHQLGENIAGFILSFDIVGALGGLADMIAAGINAAVQTACGMLDKIMPEAGEIAEGVAERLKNAVASVDWKKMGEVVGNGIKTALSLVAGLLDPKLFYEIGTAIGDFLVNLDWIGIVGGLTDVLAGAIASAVSAVRGLLDAIGPHLKDIAAGIAGKINDFVRQADWAELGRTIGDGIAAALDFVIVLLQAIDWDAVGEAVHTALSSIDWGSVAGRIAALLTEWFGIKARESFLKLEALSEIGTAIVEGIKEGILYAIGSIFGWLKSNLVDPVVNGVKNLLGIHSPSTVFAEIGGFIVEGLLQGISQAWQSVVDFFTAGFEAVRKLIVDTWEAVKAATSDAWGSIKETLTGVWQNLKELAENVFAGIREKIASAWDAAREKTTSAWESIKAALTQTWENLKFTAQSAFNTIKEKIVSAWTTLKTDTTSKWTEIKTTLLNTWTELKTTAGSKFQEIKQAITDKMNELRNHDWAGIGRNIVDGILSGLQSIWNSLTSWARSVKDTISDALSGAGGNSRAGSFGSTNTGGGGMSRMAVRSMPDLNNFEIPMLAKGAVIPPNREFLAVLGDQSNGTNVEAPLATIEQAVANVMGRMGASNGGSRSQTVVLEIDGREFGRAVVDFGGNEYQRIGVRLVEARA